MIYYVILLFTTCCSNCNGQFEYKYFADGSIEEKYEICNGQRNGSFIAYYPDGNVRAEGQFKNDSFHNGWTYYYESGKLQSKQDYVNGKIININIWDEEGNQLVINGNGIATTYYSKNKPSFKMGWKNNLPHGENISWYENGVVASIIFYNEGTPCGVWSFYTEEGILIRNEEQEIDCD